MTFKVLLLEVFVITVLKISILWKNIYIFVRIQDTHTHTNKSIVYLNAKYKEKLNFLHNWATISFWANIMYLALWEMKINLDGGLCPLQG